MKVYWIALYKEIKDKENLQKYTEVAVPILKKYGGVPLVRGGNHETFDGDDFVRTVVWEFPSYEQALKCHESKEYLAGWNLAKETTTRHMQIIEGFSTE